jgi:hypothetical protein
VERFLIGHLRPGGIEALLAQPPFMDRISRSAVIDNSLPQKQFRQPIHGPGHPNRLPNIAARQESGPADHHGVQPNVCVKDIPALCCHGLRESVRPPHFQACDIVPQ